MNDVWYSQDGANWTQATAHASWTARYGHAALVFDNKIWVLGGTCYWNPGGTGNDIWNSTDGITWTQVVAHAAWSPRSGHAVAVFDGRMWVLGGAGGLGYDVWYSANGVDWAQATLHVPWAGRYDHTATVFDGKLWVMGGQTGNWPRPDVNDVWYTSDGLNWTQATASAAWYPRCGHASAVFDNDLWVLGGQYVWQSGLQGGTTYFDDRWRSADGVAWTADTHTSPWLARSFHTTAVFDGKLWVLGGCRGAFYNSLNDVWYLPSSSGEGEGEGETVTATIDASPPGWIEEGGPLTLTLSAPGITDKAAYQWSKDAAPITDATADEYHIDSLRVEDSGWYGCEITDPAKAVINPPPVLVQVFPAGSLPAAGLASSILTGAGCLLALAWSKRRKREKGRST